MIDSLNIKSTLVVVCVLACIFGCQLPAEKMRSKPQYFEKELVQFPTVNPNKKLLIKRALEGNPAWVFKTFTEPEYMKVWWTPTTQFEIDLEVGGHYKIERIANEERYVAQGVYREIRPPNELIFTYGMPQFSPNMDTISISIRPGSNLGSLVTFEVTGKNINEELSQLPADSISNSERGWNQAFDLIEAAWKAKQ